MNYKQFSKDIFRYIVVIVVIFIQDFRDVTQVRNIGSSQ